MRYLALLLLLALPAQGAERVIEVYPWPLVADRALSRGDCALALRLLWPRAFEGHSEAIGRLGDIVESGACPDRGLPRPALLYARLIEAGADLAKARLGRLREESGRDEEAVVLYRAAVLGTIPDLWPTTRREVFAAALRPHPLPPALDAELARLEAVEADGTLTVELGRQLREGDGVRPDEAAARELLLRGAYRQLPEALYALGVWELGTLRDPRRRREAFDRIHRAAELGHPPAIRHIALQLFEGRDVREWDFRTYIWLLHAREAGWDVHAELAVVASRLSALERSVATDWLRENGPPTIHFDPG